MFDILPTDDLKSYALRMAHFGILGGLVGLAIAALLLLQNFYLMYALSKIRGELRMVSRCLKGIGSERDD